MPRRPVIPGRPPARGDLALFQQALQAHREGRREEAQRGYRKVLAADPRHLDALRLSASLDMQAGDAAAAMALYDRAVRIAPKRADILNDRGVALQRLGRLDDAIADLDESLRLEPRSAEAFYNLGNVLALLERRDEALVRYGEAIRLKPDHAEAFHNRGAVLQMLGRLEEAVAAYTEAIRLKPDHAEAFFNRGNALALQGRNADALSSYDEAIRLKAGHSGAFNNRGLALQDLGRFDEALAGYSEAIRLRPGFPGASVNRARLRLYRRDLRAGFAEFHHRWHEPSPTSLPQPTTLPACRPDTLRGRLLLWAEQGIGDEVFFAGLLPELLKRDVAVTLTADRRLHALFARSFPQIQLLDRAAAMRVSIDSGYDAQAPMGDLAHLLDVDAASVAASRTVYLRTDPRRREQMRVKVAALGGGRVCGIAWHSANKRFSAAKSIDPVQLRPLLEMPDTVFVNLQYGAVDAELEALHRETGLRIHRIEGLDVRDDIDGLAALIDVCDAIVTVSNVTVHLAGALGKRGAVLVPYSKGRLWYWHEGDERSLWYPSLRVFGQLDPVDWSAPVAACARWRQEAAHVGLLNDRGVALERLGRPKEALAGYEQALAIDPTHVEALFNRGNALAALKRPEEALASYTEVIRLKPDHALAFHNRAVVLQMLGRFDEALASYAEAIRLKPDHADAYSNRGVALRALGRSEEALASYAEAVRLRPAHADAFNNRGLVFQDLKRFDEAFASFSEAIRLKPGHDGAYANRARLQLLLRRFPAGYADYRHRVAESDFVGSLQRTTLPRCEPDTLQGRLLLWAEQGLGDELFFAGLLPELLKREVSVTLSAEKRLHPLLARSFPQIRLLERAVAMRASIDSGYDVQTPIGDLGYLLRMDTPSIAATRTVYLRADERRREEMRAKVAALGGRRVCGIAWRSANKKFSVSKSIDLLRLRALLETPETVFVNLQYGPVDAELAALHDKTGLGIHRIEGLDVREDIDGLAALIDACDAVVTTSNVTVHLAGALGKPGAVLVPHARGRPWYWHEGDARSLWYPSLGLFSQDEPSDWSRPIAACTRWLQGL